MADLTIMTSIRPATLSKKIRRAPDGALIREGGGLLVEGQAQVANVSSLADFGLLLEKLRPSQALTYGVPRGGSRKIMSRAALARQPCFDGITTRTRDQFEWPKRSGILMLDHDPGNQTLSKDDLVGVIRGAAPGLAQAAMLWWPSASSHICNAASGDDLTGLRGQRLYMMVSDAADIPRAGAGRLGMDGLRSARQGLRSNAVRLMHRSGNPSGWILPLAPFAAPVWFSAAADLC